MADDKLTNIELAADIVSAYVSNNKIEPDQLSSLVKTVYASLISASEPPPPIEEATNKPTNAQIKKSITADALISFVDGRPYKTLKRHLSTHGLTLNEYKAHYGLPRDYPSTAPSYSERRSAMAKTMGLGARGRAAGALPKSSSLKTPSKAGRKRKAAPAEGG